MELQLNIVGVAGYYASFRFGKEVMFMETFLEILREVLKGVMREWSAYVFPENVLENKKTTPCRWREGTKKVPLNRNAESLTFSEGLCIFSLIRKL